MSRSTETIIDEQAILERQLAREARDEQARADQRLREARLRKPEVPEEQKYWKAFQRVKEVMGR